MGFQVSNCFYLKKLGIFCSKLGTKLYASTYNKGKLEKRFKLQKRASILSCKLFFPRILP